MSDKQIPEELRCKVVSDCPNYGEVVVYPTQEYWDSVRRHIPDTTDWRDGLKGCSRHAGEMTDPQMVDDTGRPSWVLKKPEYKTDCPREFADDLTITVTEDDFGGES